MIWITACEGADFARFLWVTFYLMKLRFSINWFRGKLLPTVWIEIDVITVLIIFVLSLREGVFMIYNLFFASYRFICLRRTDFDHLWRLTHQTKKNLNFSFGKFGTLQTEQAMDSYCTKNWFYQTKNNQIIIKSYATSTIRVHFQV